MKHATQKHTCTQNTLNAHIKHQALRATAIEGKVKRHRELIRPHGGSDGCRIGRGNKCSRNQQRQNYVLDQHL